MASGGPRPRGPVQARRAYELEAQSLLVDLLGPRVRPDLRWLRDLTGADDAAIGQVTAEWQSLCSLERSIRRLLERSRRAYYAQFPAPLELYAITRILQPRHVVESGVSSGLSTAHLLIALARIGRGTLHSIDLPVYQRARSRRRGELSWSIPPGMDSGWAIPRHLKRNWDLRQGKSEDLLPSLVADVGDVGLFCHDSPWTPQHLAFEFEAIRPGLRPGSIVVADNTDHNPVAAKGLAHAFGTRVWHRRASTLIGIRIPI